MRALVFEHDVARYLAARTLYGLRRSWWSVARSPLRARSLPRPEPSRPGWVRLGVRRAGVCGTDLSLLTGSDSLYLEPEASYPFVPGHEVVGVVEAVGPGVERVREGQRVAVWAPLGCRVRGQPPCAPCAAGWDGLCEGRGAAWPGRGLGLGFSAEAGGGWAEACLAHESQLWPLPPSVSDEEAVLLDPAATALAALLRTEAAVDGSPPDEGRTLVIGGGTIGLLAGHLHRTLGRPGACELLVRHAFQQQWAEARGLTASIVRGEAGWAAWASERGLSAVKVPGYGRAWRGAFDRVLVTAGSREALAWALRAVRPGGRVALVAAPTALGRLDPAPVWYREVTVRGIYVYGPVPWEGAWRHPYEVLVPALAEGRLALGGLVTHTYGLGDYVEALNGAVRRAGSGAIKVTFRPEREEGAA